MQMSKQTTKNPVKPGGFYGGIARFYRQPYIFTMVTNQVNYDGLPDTPDRVQRILFKGCLSPREYYAGTTTSLFSCQLR
jgi:hypothetical protein